MDREVTLLEVLTAREARAARQRELTEEFRLPLISFTMNIAGPIKNSPVIRRAFHEGLHRVTDALAAGRVGTARLEKVEAVTGCEALIAVEGEAGAIKELCLEIEDRDPLGRLFDIDVISPNGEKLDREETGRGPRPCLVCGEPGRGCASRRAHSVPELQAATAAILEGHFGPRDAERMAAQAARALIYEVCATPKPGLVDRANNGSHRDMDVFTFVDSAAALLPYFRRAAELGRETHGAAPDETFALLRREGIAAEREMFRATGGVNTHKGAIFTLGIVCAAAGRLWRPEHPWAGEGAVLRECAAMSKKAVEADFAAMSAAPPSTHGHRLFLTGGQRGIRGELAAGLPSVREVGLPALKEALSAGGTLERAGCAALIRMIASVEDTNLLSRGGIQGQRWAAEEAARVPGPLPDVEALSALDREFIARGLSPGGCADLLAVTYFLHFCGSGDVWDIIEENEN